MVAHGRVTVTRPGQGVWVWAEGDRLGEYSGEGDDSRLTPGLQNAMSPPTETRSGDQRPVQPCPVSSL